MSVLHIILLVSGFVNGILFGLLCLMSNKAGRKSQQIFTVIKNLRMLSRKTEWGSHTLGAFADALEKINSNKI